MSLDSIFLNPNPYPLPSADNRQAVMQYVGKKPAAGNIRKFSSRAELYDYLVNAKNAGEVLKGFPAVLSALQSEIDSSRAKGETLVIHAGYFDENPYHTEFFARLLERLKKVDFVMSEVFNRGQRDMELEEINSDNCGDLDVMLQIQKFFSARGSQQEKNPLALIRFNLIQGMLRTTGAFDNNRLFGSLDKLADAEMAILRIAKKKGLEILESDLPSEWLGRYHYALPPDLFHDMRESFMAKVIKKQAPQGSVVLMQTGDYHLNKADGVPRFFNQLFGRRGRIFSVYLTGGIYHQCHKLDSILKEIGLGKEVTGIRLKFPDSIIQQGEMIISLPFEKDKEIDCGTIIRRWLAPPLL